MPRPALEERIEEESPSSSNQPTNDSDFMTVDQVAERFGTVNKTVYAWASKGRLHPVKINGRLHFSRKDVEAERSRFAFERVGGINKNQKIARDMPVAGDVQKPTGRAIQVLDPRFGEISADATKMFRSGQGVCDVVVDLKIPFAVAGQIFDDYKSYSNEIHLNAKTISMLRQRLNWVENPPTIDGFIRALDDWETYIVEMAKRENKVKKTTASEAPKTEEKPTPESSERVVPPEVLASVNFDEE